jgi:hypothetical protein
MKNIVLSAVAVLAMSSFATAGGNIAPIIPVENEDIVVDESGFYAGLGFTYNIVYSKDHAFFSRNKTQDDTYGGTGIIGYDFNNYIAV